MSPTGVTGTQVPEPSRAASWGAHSQKLDIGNRGDLEPGTRLSQAGSPSGTKYMPLFSLKLLIVPGLRIWLNKSTTFIINQLLRMD